MQNVRDLEPKSVFGYFKDLTEIPRGSGNMKMVSDYCMEFARKHSLKAVRDSANNVIIYKPASKGYEGAEPIILQGHLDMVCQKDEGVNIDFEKDGLDIFVDGDYIKAKGTTLGADNGIAVAMMLAILENTEISHPPIEAVFTTDEEVGMLGAMALSMNGLNGKRMINIDSEDSKVVTVSCAGGSDFRMLIPLKREKEKGRAITVCVKGLKGGHSGVEINSGRVNANILMGRILGHIKANFDIDIISIDGGDKGNAIPLASSAKLIAKDEGAVISALNSYAAVIKEEIASREEGFYLEIKSDGEGEYDIIKAPDTDSLVTLFFLAPNGVVEMSREIEGLVETSLNLGIVKTENDNLLMHFTLRSNKKSALAYLEEKLTAFASSVECTVEKSGHYPPWEFNSNSTLQGIYKEKYKGKFGEEPSVEAIHAGLECGVFASQIDGFDCISIGPEMHDIHTSKERLGITSTKEIYGIILEVLKSLC